MLLVKAKDLQQQRQQELEAQEQQAASMQGNLFHSLF